VGDVTRAFHDTFPIQYVGRAACCNNECMGSRDDELYECMILMNLPHCHVHDMFCCRASFQHTVAVSSSSSYCFDSPTDFGVPPRGVQGFFPSREVVHFGKSRLSGTCLWAALLGLAVLCAVPTVRSGQVASRPACFQRWGDISLSGSSGSGNEEELVAADPGDGGSIMVSEEMSREERRKLKKARKKEAREAEKTAEMVRQINMARRKQILFLYLPFPPLSLNPQPSTLNPQPSTLNPQPSTSLLLISHFLLLLHLLPRKPS